MITPITTAQFSLLRSDTQISHLSLVVLRPNAIASTILTDLPANLRWPMSFGTSGGDLSSVRRGTLIYLGTSPGLDDIGRVIARGAPSGNWIPVYPCTGITWTRWAHVTITDEIEIHAGRIIDNSTLDYGTAWSSVYQQQSPVPVMGGDSVVRVGETLPRQSFSWHPQGGTLLHSWACPGAAITGASTETPTMTFSARGNHRLSLTVTKDGVSSTSYRRVLVVDDSDFIPITLLGNVFGGDGGHSAQVKLPAGVLKGGERVALVATSEYYNGQFASLGQVKGCENIVLSGWIRGVVDRQDKVGQWAEAEIVGWQTKLEIRNPQYRIERVIGEANGYLQLKNPTLRSVIWHTAQVESNIAEVMDVWADDGLVMPTIEHSRQQLLAQIIDVAGIACGTAGCDRWGRLSITRDADINTSVPVIAELADDDIAASITTRRDVGYERAVVVSGTLAPPYANTSNGYSIAPGNSHNAPDVVNIDGLVAGAQEELNVITGRLYNRYNQPVDLTLTLAQNNRLIDLYPAQIVKWRDTLYLPKRIEWILQDGCVLVELSMAKIQENALPAETMTIPEYDEESGTVLEVELPPIDTPEMPPISFPVEPPPFPIDPTETKQIFPKSIFLLTNGGLFYTFDPDNPVAPTWQKAGGVIIPSGAWGLDYREDTLYVVGNQFVLSAQKDTMALAYRFDPGKIIAAYGLTWDMKPNAAIGAFGVNRQTGEAAMIVGRRFGGAVGDLWVDFSNKQSLAYPIVETGISYRGAFVENHGFVVSYPYLDQSRILKFGSGWQEAPSSITNGYKMVGVFGDVIYFADVFAHIFYTTDLTSFTATQIYSASRLGLADNLIVFVNAQFRHLRKSTDGGISSELVDTPSNFSVYTVHVIDANNWIIAGNLQIFGQNTIAVYRTDDGGTTWWPMYSNLPEQTKDLLLYDMLVIG